VTARYGPHDPATAPTTVTVRPPGKYQHDTEVPIPQVFLDQRQAINDRAHGLEVVSRPRRAGKNTEAAAIARAQRDTAMDAVDEGPNVTPEWKDAARRALWHLATSRPTFTTDDVWNHLDQQGVPAPEEPRALGPIVFKALRAGAIRDTGQMVRSTRRHAAKITVYERAPE
jgi:hypothetical protein